jgi:hypothetical protein
MKASMDLMSFNMDSMKNYMELMKDNMDPSPPEEGHRGP